MDIFRYGASAYHGRSSITLIDPMVSWSESLKTIEIKKARVKDFSTKSRHNYTITLSLEEMVKVFHAVASAANRNPELLADMHPQALKSLLQIQAAIVGFIPPNISANNDIQKATLSGRQSP